MIHSRDELSPCRCGWSAACTDRHVRGSSGLERGACEWIQPTAGCAITQDGNAGLVKLALAAHAMRAIQRLTQTYVTLPLAAIATEAGLASAAEAEHYLLRCTPSLISSNTRS